MPLLGRGLGDRVAGRGVGHRGGDRREGVERGLRSRAQRSGRGDEGARGGGAGGAEKSVLTRRRGDLGTPILTLEIWFWFHPPCPGTQGSLLHGADGRKETNYA